ncbi:sensory box protein [Piscirickettsia salmonis]|uniref:Aerotaxis receptor n=1 Tax=Piscirickettsia salmonis TaxID=1238 RepID=A0A9Q6LNY3_PISSA|nr:PAS domain-containing methyl-accepting chemotaxis protein [Piscirickettsia salmonis]ALA23923.1 sensory box protein [Piscirickettsia salmonis]APS44338.1 sensory box protein [Piscirickettsia salmonis]APS47699.1 sensory box protein [Piscirickettsia salmonis]APS50871.1 sensory box protein [Piscirickettsia salmonis]APS54074.1 sensory box protein [Piscirickettsia salmonis]
MRKNLPVTDSEVTFSEDLPLISRTTPRGVIVSANDAFCKVAQFSESELVGQPHNTVRHPDMPQAVFADLWSNIKEGSSWMGLVKNRCKGGDYYWVSAFITPLKRDGEIIGYESNRVKPTEKSLQRAKQAYRLLNKGKMPFNRFNMISLTAKLQGLIAAVILALFAVFYFFNMLTVSGGVIAVPILVIFINIVINLLMKDYNKSVKEAKQIVNNPLMQYIYTGSVGDRGAIELANIFSDCKIRTLRERLKLAIHEINAIGERTTQSALDSNSEAKKQEEYLEVVSAAISSIAVKSAKIVASTKNTSNTTSIAAHQADHGNQVVENTIFIVEELSIDVATSVRLIEELEEKSNEIEQVVDSVRTIAEQTNLLALNAAIEAARAGEQGRGFAVVADEVRALAYRTDESTVEIFKMIEELRENVSNVVNSMRQSAEGAYSAVDQSLLTSDSISELVVAMNNIKNMNSHVATTTDEQNNMTKKIEEQVSSTLLSVRKATELFESTKNEVKLLSNAVSDLKNLIE